MGHALDGDLPYPPAGLSADDGPCRRPRRTSPTESDEPPSCGVAFGFTRPAGLQSRVEPRIARVVHRAHLRLVRELVRWDEVLPPHVGRIHLQFARQHVHRALDKVGRFRTPRSAIRVGRRLVGEHFGEGRADGGNVVGRVRHQHRERGNGGREQHVVGADVGDEPQLQPEHGAIALGCNIHIADDVAPVRCGHERLRTVFHPLHREPQAPGHHGGNIFLGVDVDLRAEAAANLWGDGPDLILPHAGHGRDHRAEDVRILRRRPDGHGALARLEVSDHTSRLHRVRDETLIDHAL
jgi:hypothetical protein